MNFRLPRLIASGCAVVIVSLIIWLSVGRDLVSERAREDGLETMIAREKAASFPITGNETTTSGGMAAAALLATSGKSLEEHAALAIIETPGLARAALLESMMARLTRENWRSVFDVMWRARQEGLISEREEYYFLQRVGEVGGAEAMGEFKPKDPVNDWDTKDGRQAMRGWSHADPSAAMTWLEAQDEGKYRMGMAQGFVRGVAAQDPKSALRATAMLPAGDQQWLMNSMLKVEEAPFYLPFVQQWLNGSTLDAQDPDTRQKQAQVFGLLMETKINTLRDDRDGSRLVQWMEQFEGRPFVSAPALAVAADSLGSRMETSRVIELLERFAVPVQPGQRNPVGEQVGRWAKADPVAAQQWLNDHGGSPNYDSAVISFVRNAAIADPAVRRAWIETLSDVGLRAEALRSLSDTPSQAPKIR